MMVFKEANICIVGLGLMGSSLARKLHGHCKNLVGVDLNESTLNLALKKGWIDTGHTTISEVNPYPDLVILCIPIRRILNFLEQEIHAIKNPCVVIDFGSTKRMIIQKMEKLPDRFCCYACHPMCGRERSGPQASLPALFTGAPFLILPILQAPVHHPLVTTLITLIGANRIPMDADQHDFQMAYISHVPYLLSAALILVTDQDCNTQLEALGKIAANGFQDMTRLAGSDVTMMTDILVTNQEPITQVLKKLTDQLSELNEIIQRGNPEEIAPLLTRVKSLKERAAK